MGFKIKKILTAVATIICVVASKLSAQNNFPSSGNVDICKVYLFAPLFVKGGTPNAILVSTNPGIELRNSNGSSNFQMGLASGYCAYNRFTKNGDFSLDNRNGLGNLFIRNSDGRDVIFKIGVRGWGSTARVMTIFNNGKVGIGNTTSITGDYKLVVEGAIGAEKIRVTQLGWADYVSGHTYKLLLIQDLTNFLNLRQHLPNVSSAINVVKDGIDLADDQVILIKIEELTLCVIKQGKKIDDIQEEKAQMSEDNALLKKRV